MRITGGQYRNRRLSAPKGMDVRPSTDMVRQAAFNILRSYGLPEGVVAVDGFCGTGALGLEALSRGAAFCTFIDKAAASLQACRANIEMLGIEDQCRVLKADMGRLTAAPPTAQADLFFLDPPYRQGLVMPALATLAANGWLAPSATGVIECETTMQDALPPGFVLESRRHYGDTDLLILTYSPD